MAKRRKRGGSIHLRKDGRWEGRYVVGRDGRGFPIIKNVLAKSKAECAAKLEQLRETLDIPPAFSSFDALHFDASLPVLSDLPPDWAGGDNT